MHMFPFRKYKRKVGIWFGMLLTAILLVGCGKKVSWPSEEELAALQYMEKMEVEDYYGDGAYYEAYVPKGSSNEDGSVSYFDHGIIYFASACSLDSTSELYEYMDDTVQYTVDDWQDENFGNADQVELSKTKKNGDDRYQFASAMKENIFDGSKFGARAVFYLDVQEKGGGVLWDLEVEEGNVDEETALILHEIATCYRIDLEEIETAVGEWIAAESDRTEKQQDIYEPEEGDIVLEEVEGYQYMGMATLTAGDGETTCPVMAPRGGDVSIWDNHVSSSLHGVSVTGSLRTIAPQWFMKSVESEIDISYGVYQKDTDRYRNVRKTNMMPISDYEEALYAIITYEELDSSTQEYFPGVRVRSFIRVSDDYVLEYDIELSYDKYDNSTDTVIKELETAYGIDLSEYYYGEWNETKD